MSHHTIPGTALRFRGDVKFGQFAAKPVGVEPADRDALDPVDCELTLLSGEPITHPYWGTCMFDLAGAHVHKPTYPLDYCHDPSELVGKFDAPVAGDGGTYTAAASVIPFAADDRASEIIHRQAAGTPYEASIFFDPATCQVECLDHGQVGQVNGKQVEGPLTIFRSFDVRGCALCPAGADKFAHAAFSASEFSIPITGIPRNSAMAASAVPATQPVPATAAAAAVALPSIAPTAPAASADVAAGQLSSLPSAPAAAGVVAPEQLRAVEGKRFTDAFGPLGAAYFAAGETFESAAGKFAASLRVENEQLKTRLAGATLAGAASVNGQLAAGEVVPVSTDAAGSDTSKTLSVDQVRFGKNVGAFMAACKLPK